MQTQGPLSGQTLGSKYLLAELLGEGGFGAVYRGHHLLLDRPQAIKVLHEHYFRKPEFRERFLREAKIVAALDHPHIVHIDDFGMDEQEAKTYLVMPFISGGTFSEILKELQEPLPVEQVVLYLEQICSALDYAHQRGVVHLDLKPLNLLIREGGSLLLSDFGLAHSLNQEAVDGGTSLGHGTPHYMAPEHINGQPNKSSDVYALGILLFQMLVSQLPFRGGTPEAIKAKHLTKSPPLLRSLRPELPIELEEVLERALAKQAEQRFRSPTALLTAFKGALARVQEQVLKAEEERRRKVEEERARKAEEERLQKVEEEQALRNEIERLQMAEEDQAREAEQERLQRMKQEQALRNEIEQLQKAKDDQAREAEQEQLQRMKQEQALRSQIEQLQNAKEDQTRKIEEERRIRVEEQALRIKLEYSQKIEKERARKAEIERLRKAKEEQALRAQIERLQATKQAAIESLPVVQKQDDAAPATTSSGNTNTPILDAPANKSHRLITQVYGEDAPQPPSTPGQSISSKLPNTPAATGASISDKKTARTRQNKKEQTIYVSPDDDLTTVRERLEQIPSHKITLVIPSQTQLRSHVAWKLLYARTCELGKEVLIVSSDPQVRSVAHAVKFKVAHSLESTSNRGRSKSGSRAGTGRSNSGANRSRPAGPSPGTTTHATIAKEPTSRRGASRSPRSTHPPVSGRAPAWSESSPFIPSEGRGQAPPLRREEPLRREDPSRRDAPLRREDPQTGIPREPRSQRSKRSERNEMREERGASPDQIYGFRAEGPSSAIHPLPLNQIEEPDLLIEDYNQAQDIRQAASGSIPVIQRSGNEDAGAGGAGASPVPMSEEVNVHISEAGVSPSPLDQPHRPNPPVYGDDDPFIYMQDDSQPPSQSEQKAETILHDDEISQEFPFLQKSAISDLPTHVIEERETKYRGDEEDDSIPPIGSPGAGAGATQGRSRDDNEERPSRLSPRPYGVPPWGGQVQGGDKPRPYESPARQTFNEEEDQLPALPEPTMPMQVPQPISLPMPRAQSKPLVHASKPLPPRTGGQMPQQAPAQKPRTGPTTRNGSRVSTSAGSRPASQPIQQPRGSASPKSTTSPNTRRPVTRSRLRRPKRLYLILASIVALFVILFGVLYLNTTSTVKLTVITQNYAHPLTLTLSEKNQPGTVPAKFMRNTFTQTGSEPATGSTMQVTNQATGIVNFTNTGTTSVQIETGTIIATASNIKFVTTATALIPPPSPNTLPLPVPIQASNQGVSGNVPARSITVIPQDSLTSIAAAQSPPVTAESLKGTLTVSNPEAITGGDAHQVPAVTQRDLDNAKQDLHQQLVGAINAWVQQYAKNALVGQLVTTDTLTNAPTVDTPEPNKTFSASISVATSILVAQLNDVRGVAQSQLKNAVQADKLFGTTFDIIGDPQTITIDLAQQSAGDGNTVTVPVTGKAGPNLNKADLQNSIKGKSFSDAEAILRKKQGIKTVDIKTQPGIFYWVSPWMDHINMIIESA